jgi:hypothetical protein
MGKQQAKRAAEEWLDLEDPDAPGWFWRLHVPFLLSSYTCIFGRGCPGAHSDANVGCCSLGTPLGPSIDGDTEAELARVRENVEALTDEDWQRRRKGLGKKGWTTTNQFGELATRIVDGACIFANDLDFPGGAGCAFHVAALRRGESYVEWKPDTCWRVPLHVEELADEPVWLLRATRAEDWDGETGTDPDCVDWWCTNSALAGIAETPVFERFEEELRHILGDEVFETAATELRRRRGPRPVPLPMAL